VSTGSSFLNLPQATQQQVVIILLQLPPALSMHVTQVVKRSFKFQEWCHLHLHLSGRPSIGRTAPWHLGQI